MTLAAFQQNCLLWMTPEWGSKSGPKIGFADRASPVFRICKCRVMSCHVASCHVASCHVMSCHVMSCHVMSCHVMSCHVVLCRVTSRPVLSRCVVSRREKRPHQIVATTSLLTYASARHSHSHNLCSHLSRSYKSHLHHSHLYAHITLFTSHSYRFRLPTQIF